MLGAAVLPLTLHLSPLGRGTFDSAYLLLQEKGLKDKGNSKFQVGHGL